ncbi:arabinosyltransferase C-terminal domain-containing protein [Mycobacterium sp. E136]|uniref:arabinosyltransferase C-terminal domain-containing protein n=1 Tax=Mycobacterium sp. E136 TaxID=1834125 RepID=UPI001E286FC6|nr:arabinosyltransferase C-terminal domain-containing protein [Mycobacterium sp. E136]
MPYKLDPASTPVMGSWRPGTQQPAQLRSAWYRLPSRDDVGPLLVVSAAGRFDAGVLAGSSLYGSRAREPLTPAAAVVPPSVPPLPA